MTKPTPECNLPAPTQADPADDVPAPQRQLAALLGHQLATGVPHGELISYLLGAAEAMAVVYPCCAKATGQAALQLGGRLICATHTPATMH